MVVILSTRNLHIVSRIHSLHILGLIFYLRETVLPPHSKHFPHKFLQMNQIVHIFFPYQIRKKFPGGATELIYQLTIIKKNRCKKKQVVLITMPKCSQYFCNSLFSIQLCQITSFNSYLATEIPLQKYNIMPWPLSGVDIRDLIMTNNSVLFVTVLLKTLSRSLI